MRTLSMQCQCKQKIKNPSKFISIKAKFDSLEMQIINKFFLNDDKKTAVFKIF